MMLAQARVLGYVFNPLTVYWCHRADGATLPEPDGGLALSVVLDRPDGHSFTASVRGRAVPATAPIGVAARHPWSTAAVAARIRWQGVKLYARGLRVAPRPAHRPQEGVQ